MIWSDLIVYFLTILFVTLLKLKITVKKEVISLSLNNQNENHITVYIREINNTYSNRNTHFVIYYSH